MGQALRSRDTPPRGRYRPDDLLGPLNLVERQNAPEWLHIEGDATLPRSQARVSIVGTRTPSPDGLKRAGRLARELVARGVVVVSGLARGIDAAAHRTAIEASGRTIAILGTPLDVAYPLENTALQRETAERHLLVSQFRPATRRAVPTSLAATAAWRFSRTPR